MFLIVQPLALSAFLSFLFTSFLHAAPSHFIHPGVVVDLDRLSYIHSQLDNEPFKSAYQKAMQSKLGTHKNYKVLGPPSSGIIECGSYSHPNFGCGDEDNDGAAAVLQLLLFALTNDTAYSKNAKAILNSYGYGLKGYNNSNAHLQAAWGASKWARAAELAKHLPGVDWADNDVSVFETMLQHVSLPMLYGGSKKNGNWELSMISGLMGMAVFLDNATLFDHAVNMWKARIPAYFYLESVDGGKPQPAPRGNPKWYGQKTFNKSTSGHCQETCRDEGHTGYGVAETFNAAETAYIQGVDLYSAEKDRLVKALEYNTNWLNGQKIPMYVCEGSITLTMRPTYEIGYNGLSIRLGMHMPSTLEYLQKKVRTSSKPYDTHMMIFETLTHAGSPPTNYFDKMMPIF